MQTLKRIVKDFRERRRRSRLFGALAPMVPPLAAMFDGNADLDEFKSNGEEFLGIYRDICGLRRDERMLDVGSGIGRKTIPLTQYFDACAVYEGIDVNAAGVDWCQRTISSRYPNFRFQLIDVRNDLYNPNGWCEAAEYRFPFDDDSFTFVMLGSVFTHMQTREIERYLSEIARVMANGRCLISWFLLNDESRRLLADGRSSLPFGEERDRCATISREVPERAMAFDEELVRSLYARAGLTIARVDHGSWCGRADALSYQDLVLATPSAEPPP